MIFEKSDKPQVITVYNLRADTKEFIGKSDAYILPHNDLPANCALLPPPEIPAGHVAEFDERNAEWSLAEDHRREIVYDIRNGSPVLITQLGTTPKHTVNIAPSGQYDKWNGSAWVKDENAEKTAHLEKAITKRDYLIDMACTMIREWHSELLLGSISDEDKNKLQIWIDYIKTLKSMDLTSDSCIIWPMLPDEKSSG